METKLFLLPITSFDWTETDERLLKYVSCKRQQKIRRFFFPSDKRHSLYAALLTRMEISLALKHPASSLNFDADSNNKPFLVGATDFHFNMSHTKGAILLGISGASIGVDIESNKNPAFDIMPNYFHEAEVDYVSNAPSPDLKSTFFFNVWTRKEAFTKYTGKGLAYNLKTLNTLDPSLEPNFTTWSYSSFVCSVYTKAAIKDSPVILSERDIINFFHTL